MYIEHQETAEEQKGVGYMRIINDEACCRYIINVLERQARIQARINDTSHEDSEDNTVRQTLTERI